MDAGFGPVDGLAGFDELAGVGGSEVARVAEPGKDLLVVVEVADGGFVGDGEDDLVTAFLGLADFPEAGARGCSGEGFEVAVDVACVGELAGFAGDASEELEG